MHTSEHTIESGARKGKLAAMLFALLFSISVVAPMVAFAQTTPATAGDYQMLAPLPCIESSTTSTACGGTGNLITQASFKGYIQYMFNLLIALGAVAAVFMIVWGGFTYMYTASSTKKAEGMDKVKNALYGLILVLCSFIILRTIDPRLVQISDTLVPPLTLKSDSTNYEALMSNDLAAQIQADNVQTAQMAASSSVAYAAAAATYANTVKNAQLSLNDLKDKMNAQGCTTSSTDATCSNMRLQAQQLQNTVNTNTAASLTSSAKSQFNNVVNNELYNGGNISVEKKASDLKIIMDTYNQNLILLKAINAGDKITELTAAKDAAIASLANTKIVQ